MFKIFKNFKAHIEKEVEKLIIDLRSDNFIF